MQFRQGAAIAALSILLLPLFIIRGHRTESDKGAAAPAVIPPPHGYVQIQGSVELPGIYPISDNELTIAVINLAKPACETGAIPGLNIFERKAVTGDLYTITCKRKSDRAEILIQEMSPAVAMIMGIPFSINKASAKDLERLPDIGLRTAEKIIEHRQINGGFNKLEDLMMVEGIGEKKFAKIIKYLKL